MTRKPWTTTEQKRLAEMVNAGMSATDVGVILDRNVHSLYWKAKELGLKFHGHKPHRQKISQEDKARIRLNHESGESRESLLSQYPIARNYLNQIIRGVR